MTFIGVFILVVVWEAAVGAEAATDPLLVWDDGQALLSFPVICFGFTAHVALLPIMRCVRPHARPLALACSPLLSSWVAIAPNTPCKG